MIKPSSSPTTTSNNVVNNAEPQITSDGQDFVDFFSKLRMRHSASHARTREFRDEFEAWLETNRELASNFFFSNTKHHLIMEDLIEELRIKLADVHNNPTKEENYAMTVYSLETAIQSFESVANSAMMLFRELHSLNLVITQMRMGKSFSVCCIHNSFIASKPYTIEELLEKARVRASAFFSKFPEEHGDLSTIFSCIVSFWKGFTFLTANDFVNCISEQVLRSILKATILSETFSSTVCHPIVKDFCFMLERVAEGEPKGFHKAYYHLLYEEEHVLTNPYCESTYGSWVLMFLSISSINPDSCLKTLLDSFRVVSDSEWSVAKKSVYATNLLDGVFFIVRRHGKEFVERNLQLLNELSDPTFFKNTPIRNQRQIFTIQTELERIMYGNNKSALVTYMETLQKTSSRCVVLLVELEGKKKKISLDEAYNEENIIPIFEEKLSISMNSYSIDIFDDDCEDWVVFDPSEHNFRKMKQPVKMRLEEKVDENVTETTTIKAIDNYKIIKQLQSETTEQYVSITFLAEEKQLNKENRKIILKYLNFKGNNAEERLSEMIITLKKAKDFEKSNIIPIFDILKPETINNQKIKKVQHLAFTTPYYSHGSLDNVTKERIHLNTRMILSLIKYSLEAFNSLEEARLDYGNIKTQNILVEQLDLVTSALKIRVTDWWIASKSKTPAICNLGLLLYNFLTFEKTDLKHLMSETVTSQMISDEIFKKQNKSSSSSLAIAGEVIAFLLGKFDSRIAISARQALKLLYKRVKESKESSPSK
ncbi:hypothetical protein C9374_003696 [Naegleria lovaniensis]|uniref:Protein kinase domain-containing protein n=1 Tax=Naegleria lovaniensis TaxID=51637 RepID=A0AA88H815_NAELO|nr:uncharacterized protein C9374_003696 [Naegleria lovaniensis]KAG2393932.1 hypothetical protein C9374_003696 [Naegleria lovaniensis]